MESVSDTMARSKKSQKNFWLDNDLLEWLDDHISLTGASATRIISAALLDYFFEHADGPDPLWMQQVVALEKGEADIHDIPKSFVRSKLEDAERRLAFAESNNAPEQGLQALRAEIRQWRAAAHTWKCRGPHSLDDIESRRVSPEELAKMPELQDDSEKQS